MKWLKRIGLVLVALIALFVIVGIVLPNDFRVERSVVIDAEPARVHALVGDLTRWEEWTPWKEVDPEVQTTLGSQTSGVGASQSWTDSSGGGDLVFTESSVENGIAYDMNFYMGDPESADPLASTSEMRYERVDGGTKVIWSMDGSMPVPVLGGYFAKIMPASIGPMFDSGLQKLKQRVEAEPPPAPEPVEEVDAVG